MPVMILLVAVMIFALSELLYCSRCFDTLREIVNANNANNASCDFDFEYVPIFKRSRKVLDGNSVAFKGTLTMYGGIRCPFTITRNGQLKINYTRPFSSNDQTVTFPLLVSFFGGDENEAIAVKLARWGMYLQWYNVQSELQAYPHAKQIDHRSFNLPHCDVVVDLPPYSHSHQDTPITAKLMVYRDSIASTFTSLRCEDVMPFKLHTFFSALPTGQDKTNA